jgi:hypothetical protein
MSPAEKRPQAHERLQLLLADAKAHRPVLEEGLAVESTRKAPPPRALPRRVEVPTWERPDADPNHLGAQRWGVIAPEGELGDSLLRAIAPLIEHREKQQGAAAKVYRVRPGMDAAAAALWRETVLMEESVPQRERPWYLLLLGDLHHVSMELQQVLAHGACVGRLHVGHPEGEVDLSGYAAYARKVLAHEQSAEAEAPDVLLYTVRDGTAATEAGQRLLVEPCLEAMRTRWKKERPGLEPREVPHDAGSVEGWVRAAGQARAGVMLSVSHGMGRPRAGWASAEEQRALQGALCVGPGVKLTAEEVRHKPFLPGGLWFTVACFGAATPDTSAYAVWMEQLAREGATSSQSERVQWSLPKAGERPFVAALPQALLANEQGPLAVVGHSDLAWQLSFVSMDTLGGSRASRILSALEVVANGSRVGVAHHALMREYRAVNDRLMAGYQAQQEALLYGTPDPTDPVKQGHLWMLRNDLRGYVLLGDPAARLAVRRA